MKYEVTDPKGIHCNGKHFAKGEVIPLPDGAARKAFLHFKQVIPREEKGAAGTSGGKNPATPGSPPANPPAGDKPPEKEPEKPGK